MYGPRRLKSLRDVVTSKTEERNSFIRGNDVTPISEQRNGGEQCRETGSNFFRVNGFWNKVLLMTGTNNDVTSTEDNIGRSMDVAKAVCKDYIHQKLTRKGYSTRKIRLYAANCKYSEYFVKAGSILERLYPKVYTDVSRKVSMTMTSSTIVKNTLTSVLEIMFRESVTWGKITSMFAISACFAEECIQQGHSEFVDDVINCVGNFVAIHLVEWLVKEGGWASFEEVFAGNRALGIPIAVCLLTLLVGFVLIITFIIEFA